MSNNRELSKSKFSNLINDVWQRINKSNVIKGFECTGIYPFSWEKYPEHRFNPEKLRKYKGEKEKNPLVDNSSIDPIPVVASSTPLNSSEPSVLLSSSRPTAGFTSSNQSIGSSATPIEQSSDGISPGTKFEKCLLAKVNRIDPPTNRRRQIDFNAEIITTEEFLKKIEEKMEQVKRTESIFLYENEGTNSNLAYLMFKFLIPAKEQETKEANQKKGLDGWFCQ
jgi:hypothetical protein